MYATILVAADLAKPERAQELLAQARKLCDPDGIIRLLHVLHGPVTGKLRASAMAGLLALSAESDPRVLPVLREGEVAPQIHAMAKADRSDLVMLASRLPDMTNFVTQTNAANLTRHSTITVLVARTETHERTPEHV